MGGGIDGGVQDDSPSANAPHIITQHNPNTTGTLNVAPIDEQR